MHLETIRHNILISNLNTMKKPICIILLTNVKIFIFLKADNVAINQTYMYLILAKWRGKEKQPRHRAAKSVLGTMYTWRELITGGAGFMYVSLAFIFYPFF